MNAPLLSEIAKDTVFGVNTTGNAQALSLCVASVLNAECLPACVQIRAEGEIPAFDFYLNQLSDLARLKGVEFSYHRALPNGIREARDWQIANCKKQYLWMGDDDVVYDYRCLANFLKALHTCRRPIDLGFMCGTKIDVNNRRGYVNFDLSKRPFEEVKDNCSFNHYYGIKETVNKVVKSATMDTGNVLIDCEAVNGKKIKFQMFDQSTNSGGEDTLFALECQHKGLQGLYAPAAVGYHLEKEKVNFGEFAARGEMLLRVCEQRRYSKELVAEFKKAMMPWVFR